MVYHFPTAVLSGVELFEMRNGIGSVHTNIILMKMMTGAILVDLTTFAAVNCHNSIALHVCRMG